MFYRTSPMHLYVQIFPYTNCSPYCTALYCTLQLCCTVLYFTAFHCTAFLASQVVKTMAPCHCDRGFQFDSPPVQVIIFSVFKFGYSLSLIAIVYIRSDIRSFQTTIFNNHNYIFENHNLPKIIKFYSNFTQILQFYSSI